LQQTNLLYAGNEECVILGFVAIISRFISALKFICCITQITQYVVCAKQAAVNERVLTFPVAFWMSAKKRVARVLAFRCWRNRRIWNQSVML